MTNQKLIELANRLGRDELPSKRTPKPKPASPTPAQITDPNLNLEDYIIQEGQNHGSYSYSDLVVAKKKSLHNHNWHNTQAELHKKGNFMLTIRQYIDFINLLKSNDVYEATGKKLPKTEVSRLLDEILKVRSPWRAEWLDARFTKNKKNWDIIYHKIENGTLEEITEPLETCLMKDREPGIDLNSWLNKATSQGLPLKKTPKGKIYYWYPRDGKAARFRADSGRVILSCDGYPSGSGSVLGVRAARTK